MENRELIINGYLFSNVAQAQLAARELKNIDMIRKKINYNDKESVLEVYNKLIEKDFFKTVVGYEFLVELRQFLIYDGYCEEEQLEPIKVDYVRGILEDTDDVDIGELQNDIKKLALWKTRLTIAVISLTILVAGMFFIAATNKNVGYINTENKILDKYSAWEENLNEREKAVKEKEEALEK